MKILIVVLILLLLALQLRLWAGAGSFAEVDRLSNEIDTQTEENTDLEARNGELYQEVDELKTGLDAIEERAREDLGLIKEGEVFYLIVEEETQEQ